MDKIIILKFIIINQNIILLLKIKSNISKNIILSFYLMKMQFNIPHSTYTTRIPFIFIKFSNLSQCFPKFSTKYMVVFIMATKLPALKEIKIVYEDNRRYSFKANFLLSSQSINHW